MRIAHPSNVPGRFLLLSDGIHKRDYSRWLEAFVLKLFMHLTNVLFSGYAGSANKNGQCLLMLRAC